MYQRWEEQKPRLQDWSSQPLGVKAQFLNFVAAVYGVRVPAALKGAT
jgi:hypothetical protein